MPNEPASRYVVSRCHWWWSDWKRCYYRRPGGVAIASFAGYEAADAERARLEALVRAKVNPFECGEAVHHRTHLDEPRLRDWLMDRGIDPPRAKADGACDWAAWWKKNQKKLGPEKRAAVWEALDKVRFYEIKRRPVLPVGYAVLGVNWEYNDEYYDANPDTAKLVKVFRSRDRAEAECARHNEEARGQWAHMGTEQVENPDGAYTAFDMHDWLCLRRGLMGRDELDRNEGCYPTTFGVPFFEVVEIELEGLE